MRKQTISIFTLIAYLLVGASPAPAATSLLRSTLAASITAKTAVDMTARTQSQLDYSLLTEFQQNVLTEINTLKSMDFQTGKSAPNKRSMEIILSNLKLLSKLPDSPLIRTTQLQGHITQLGVLDKLVAGNDWYVKSAIKKIIATLQNHLPSIPEIIEITPQGRFALRLDLFDLALKNASLLSGITVTRVGGSVYLDSGDRPDIDLVYDFNGNSADEKFGQFAKHLQGQLTLFGPCELRFQQTDLILNVRGWVVDISLEHHTSTVNDAVNVYKRIKEYIGYPPEQSVSIDFIRHIAQYIVAAEYYLGDDYFRWHRMRDQILAMHRFESTDRATRLQAWRDLLAEPEFEERKQYWQTKEFTHTLPSEDILKRIRNRLQNSWHAASFPFAIQEKLNAFIGNMAGPAIQGDQFAGFGYGADDAAILWLEQRLPENTKVLAINPAFEKRIWKTRKKIKAQFPNDNLTGQLGVWKNSLNLHNQSLRAATVILPLSELESFDGILDELDRVLVDEGQTLVMIPVSDSASFTDLKPETLIALQRNLQSLITRVGFDVVSEMIKDSDSHITGITLTLAKRPATLHEVAPAKLPERIDTPEDLLALKRATNESKSAPTMPDEINESAELLKAAQEIIQSPTAADSFILKKFLGLLLLNQKSLNNNELLHGTDWLLKIYELCDLLADPVRIFDVRASCVRWAKLVEIIFNRRLVAVTSTTQSFSMLTGQTVTYTPDGTIPASLIDKAAEQFLIRDNHKNLLTILEKITGQKVNLSDIKWAIGAPVKSGHFNNIYRVSVNLTNQEKTCSFTVVTDINEKNGTKTLLDFKLLEFFHNLNPRYLPEPYLSGTSSVEKEGRPVTVNLFADEWLENSYELHGNKEVNGNNFILLHPENPEENYNLQPKRSAEISRQMARIYGTYALNHYFGEGKHGVLNALSLNSGDFDLQALGDYDVIVKLITLRGISDAVSTNDALLHHFLLALMPLAISSAYRATLMGNPEAAIAGFYEGLSENPFFDKSKAAETMADLCRSAMQWIANGNYLNFFNTTYQATFLNEKGKQTVQEQAEKLIDLLAKYSNILKWNELLEIAEEEVPDEDTTMVDSSPANGPYQALIEYLLSQTNTDEDIQKAIKFIKERQENPDIELIIDVGTGDGQLASMIATTPDPTGKKRLIIGIDPFNFFGDAAEPGTYEDTALLWNKRMLPHQIDPLENYVSLRATIPGLFPALPDDVIDTALLINPTPQTLANFGSFLQRTGDNKFSHDGRFIMKPWGSENDIGIQEERKWLKWFGQWEIKAGTDIFPGIDLNDRRLPYSFTGTAPAPCFVWRTHKDTIPAASQINGGNNSSATDVSAPSLKAWPFQANNSITYSDIEIPLIRILGSDSVDYPDLSSVTEAVAIAIKNSGGLGTAHGKDALQKEGVKTEMDTIAIGVIREELTRIGKRENIRFVIVTNEGAKDGHEHEHGAVFAPNEVLGDESSSHTIYLTIDALDGTSNFALYQYAPDQREGRSNTTLAAGQRVIPFPDTIRLFGLIYNDQSRNIEFDYKKIANNKAEEAAGKISLEDAIAVFVKDYSEKMSMRYSEITIHLQGLSSDKLHRHNKLFDVLASLTDAEGNHLNFDHYTHVSITPAILAGLMPGHIYANIAGATETGMAAQALAHFENKGAKVFLQPVSDNAGYEMVIAGDYDDGAVKIPVYKRTGESVTDNAMSNRLAFSRDQIEALAETKITPEDDAEYFAAWLEQIASGKLWFRIGSETPAQQNEDDHYYALPLPALDLYETFILPSGYEFRNENGKLVLADHGILEQPSDNVDVMHTLVLNARGAFIKRKVVSHAVVTAPDPDPAFFKAA